MQISKNKVASIEYTLTNNQNNVLDTSAGRGPLVYLHGSRNLIEGLEDELEGKKVGDSFKVTIQPEKAYGLHEAGKVQKLDRKLFADIPNLELGMELEAENNGQVQYVVVSEMDDKTVTVDGNHPLAGETLHFDVKVVDIRDASGDEIAHGHVHGPHGHHH